MTSDNLLRTSRRNSINQRILRFSDIPTTIDNDLNPIDGYQSASSQSLKKALESVEHLLYNIQFYAHHSEQNCTRHNGNGLSLDQLVAIKLYTMEWEPQNKCLYFVLNEALRNKDRKKLKPWFPYLKFILTGLFQLESVSTTVFRGVKVDLHHQYPVGKEVVWWGFSSCTQKIAILESDQFLGKSGPRTIFIIKCFTGKNISKYSFFTAEEEILLLPASKFIVVASLNPASQFYMIQLEEVPSPNILLVPPDENFDVFSHSDANAFTNSLVGTELDLSEKNLLDRDLGAICKSMKNNRSLASLNLSANNITMDGALYLSNFLKTNQSLRELNLYKNKLTDFGVIKIACALEYNSTLQKLTLSLNEVTDKAVDTFVKMLHHNQSLKYLDFSRNDISDEGFSCFVDLLTTQNHLQHLFLNRNKITDKSMKGVVQILKARRSLVTLYLDENQFSDEAKERIWSTHMSQRDPVLTL